MTKSRMPNIKITQRVNRIRNFIHIIEVIFKLKHVIRGVPLSNKNTILSDGVHISPNSLIKPSLIQKETRNKILLHLRNMKDFFQDKSLSRGELQNNISNTSNIRSMSVTHLHLLIFSIRVCFKHS